MNKIDELKHCLLIYDNIEIICVTETHLDNSILDSELSIDGLIYMMKSITLKKNLVVVVGP